MLLDTKEPKKKAMFVSWLAARGLLLCWLAQSEPGDGSHEDQQSHLASATASISAAQHSPLLARSLSAFTLSNEALRR